MGLDCYLVARSPEVQRLPSAEMLRAEINLAYWRKNFPLNNRMHQFALGDDGWPPLDHYFPVGTEVDMTEDILQTLTDEGHLTFGQTEAARLHMAWGYRVLYWSVP